MTRKVGYKSPPDHTKWKPGQSGNPSGRKKGSINFKTALLAELNEQIQISEGGKSKRITKLEALIKATLAKGIKGDVRAASTVIGWIMREFSGVEEVTEPDLTAQEQAALDDLLVRHAKRVKREGGSSDDGS